MALPRAQLFEFNDSAWAPPALRESIVEALSRALTWGRMLRGLAGPFSDFLDRAGADSVLDLCSGAGGPAAILARELARQGARAPRFLLTDLHPHPDAWARLASAHPGVVEYEASSVDATRIPADLGAGRVRVIINALHHFSPDLAGAILRGACERSPGVFVAEGFERNPLLFAAFAVPGLLGLYANPALAPRRKLAKAWLTWATPTALVASVWDGLVSTLRVYTEDELRVMVAPLGDAFTWTYGTYPIGALGRGYYFYGVRAAGARAGAADGGRAPAG
ncbi:MAG: hypothetical protein IPF92_11600 [Myxococcales bacterium]|jgi:hypothetical protein|nr:hypothetical protein [Myxococcales bacterium]MBL0198278.1 hypothetical protein [Myxococcales bacterium]HQY62974.1 hypothetical protein [Polyangiaceae bacterium]